MNAITRFDLYDSHLHIVDPRFPLVANHGYLPDAFTADDYRRDHLGLSRARMPTLLALRNLHRNALDFYRPARGGRA